MLRGGEMNDVGSSGFHGRFKCRLLVSHHSQTLFLFFFFANTGMKTEGISLALEADIQNQLDCVPD
jgi:hypothetical protein